MCRFVTEYEKFKSVPVSTGRFWHLKLFLSTYQNIQAKLHKKFHDSKKLSYQIKNKSADIIILIVEELLYMNINNVLILSFYKQKFGIKIITVMLHLKLYF